MTDANPRKCNKCGEKPTKDPKISILCKEFIDALTAVGRLGSAEQQAETPAPPSRVVVPWGRRRSPAKTGRDGQPHRALDYQATVRDSRRSTPWK
ncbi:hypothetical protein [Amycolatopsis sp. 195334CR]|uniref:hypothetical protein n=1 Tax=Amycolatopsis sp. 195334CR TaxID=2814588 RepID=UPI001A8C9A09|nr:hypothetical protein [Amycolatopsis sp. 195334CR]MBN6034076.1 hypothetical protein [Amycolatopsis sp. 195334CR]